MPITVDPALSLTDRIPLAFAAMVESLITDGVNGDAIMPEDVAPPVFLRHMANLIPARDGLPCVIVCRTPGRTERDENRIRCRDTFTPLTAILCEAGNQNASVAPAPWIGTLRDALRHLVNSVGYSNLPEFHRATLDEGAYLDFTAWTDANIRAVPVSFTFFCRTNTR